MIAHILFGIFVVICSVCFEMAGALHWGTLLMPNFFLLMVIYIAWWYGALRGEIVGFLVGTVHDALGVNVFGTNMLLYTVCGYAVGTAAQRMDQHKQVLQMGVVFVSSVLYAVLVYAMHLVRTSPVLISYSVSSAVLKPLVNTVASPFVFFLWSYIARKWLRINVEENN